MQLEVTTLFKSLLRLLEAHEREKLEESILANGCEVPIMVWQGKIMDGHNRYEICRKHNIKFEVQDRSEDFENETQVMCWILDNALGRRNLNGEDKKRYIGELYNLLKMPDSARRVPETAKVAASVNTAKTLGDKFGVSERTVRNYATENERLKLIEQIKVEVQKEAIKGGYEWDEERMQEKFEEAAQSLRSDEDNEGCNPGPSDDDYNQSEPTAEQRAKAKAKSPNKSPKSKSKTMLQQQKSALKLYESCLDKLQAARLDLLFDNGLYLPDFRKAYATIETKRAEFPAPKPRFGR